jgi:hypothetical protein
MTPRVGHEGTGMLNFASVVAGRLAGQPLDKAHPR